MGRGRLVVAALVCAAVAAAGVAYARTAPERRLPPAACAIPNVPSPRNPSDPLALPAPPIAGDPLQGAHFFVDGPRHGAAAGAIAQSLRLTPMSFPDSYSWAQFQQTYGRQFSARDRLLAKIADQQETQNISLYAEGGGSRGVYGQTLKILCDNAAADPARVTVPVLSTFFIYPNGQFCPTYAALQRWQSTFLGDVNAMAAAVGSKRAVILEEIDSLGASGCLHGRALELWLHDLSWESGRFSRLPHAVVYQEAGYSDAQGPKVTAKHLWQAGVKRIEGFFTNGTHFAWSSKEITWAEKISNLLWKMSRHHYRARFVINTAQNGQGPDLNRHPRRQGVEDLCNPPRRGLGRMPTGNVNPMFDGLRFRYLDGFLWTGTPGRSHNSNCPGGPWQSAGVFDQRFALELAQHANQRLGPRYRSEPY
jgi:endoglucanase